MDNSNEPIYDARKLGIPKMLILGIQHMFAMFGATILVPILVAGYFSAACGEPITSGLTVAVTLFCAGVGTLIFHVCSKFEVPAFLGSSFAFLGGFYTVANLNTGMYAGMSANDKVAYACGGIVIAGLLYLVVAVIFKLVGVNRVMRFLPPVVTGPIIICIGLSLAPSAISNASTNWLLAVVALAVIIIFNIWGRGMFKIIPILMGVLISYGFALILNACGVTNPDGSAIIDFTSVAAANWVGIPKFQLCKFDITAILVMAPIAIATMMEHVGDMSAISATVGKNFIEEPGLHRTIMGDGLATAFAAADAGCKAGNVRLENFDKNKPANADELPVPLIVMVKFRGQVADVEAALEAATAKAESMTGIVTKYKISRPTEDTEKMLKLNAFDKGTPHKVTDEEVEEI